MVFQMSGNLFTQVFVGQKALNNRRKAEMQNFGRFVDHCDKSMTERMAERFKDDAQRFKSLLSE